ncbi:MAG: family 1 encapsulin nanocompartment shell protein, partial [Desulfosarcina sp.]
MDILKRELAPIPAEAWTEIDAQASRSLTALLSARKVVDVTEPMGTNFPGVPEGRLEYPKQQPKGGLNYGIHKVHHLVETRIPFDL